MDCFIEHSFVIIFNILERRTVIMLNFYNTCMCLTAMLYCFDDTNSACTRFLDTALISFESMIHRVNVCNKTTVVLSVEKLELLSSQYEWWAHL